MNEPTKTVLVRIEGRVQGVWYRGWTVSQAQALGLTGWVRNRYDRSVEALISGPKEDVNGLLDLLWQGPPAANVTLVTSETTEAPEGAGFHQRPTV